MVQNPGRSEAKIERSIQIEQEIKEISREREITEENRKYGLAIDFSGD